MYSQLFYFVRCLAYFLDYFTNHVRNGYMPVLMFTDRDYERLELGWYMPETSKLRLNYYTIFMGHGRPKKFVYSPKPHYNNTDSYDDIPF